MTRLWWILALSASCAQLSTAHADDRWLIVPIGTPSSELTEQAALVLHEELAAEGTKVWSPEDATTRFESAGSAPPTRLSPEEVEGWDGAADEVLRSLVRGDAEGAYRLLVEGGALSLATVSSLNRSARRAQQVLDLCMLGVRAALEREKPKEAEEMAQDCRRLVPSGEPTSYMHPPTVTELLLRVDEARRAQGATLLIQSDPAGCEARLNGQPIGHTPVESSHLVPGRYAVQVECGDEAGRLHGVDVGAGFTEVDVDARFDSTVVTRPMLGLRYADQARADELRSRDTDALAAVVPADNLVVITRTHDAGLDLELLHGPSQERLGLVRLASTENGPARSDVALAAQALTEHRCTDLTTAPPTDLVCQVDSSENVVEERPTTARMPPGKFRAGLTLTSLGTVTLLTGYVLLAPRARRADDWVERLDMGLGGASSQERWINIGIWQVALASVGGASLVSAMPLVLPKRRRVPWWGWLAGGLGLGAAGFSIAYGVTAQSEPSTPCSNTVTDPDDARTCVQRSAHINTAILVGATSAALLTIPLVYLLRPSRSKLSPEVQVSPQGGYAGLRGRF